MKKFIAGLSFIAASAGCVHDLPVQPPVRAESNEVRLSRVVEAFENGLLFPYVLVQSGREVKVDLLDVDGDGSDDISLTVGRQFGGAEEFVIVDSQANGSIDSVRRAEHFEIGGRDLVVYAELGSASRYALAGAYHRLVSNLDDCVSHSCDETNPNLDIALRRVSPAPYHRRFREVRDMLSSLVVEDVHTAGYRFSLETSEVEIVMNSKGNAFMSSKVTLNDDRVLQSYDEHMNGIVNRADMDCALSSADRLAVGDAAYRIVVSALHERLVLRREIGPEYSEMLSQVLRMTCVD
ncbi:hypothetical protein KY362_01305 [Candidatus Woesearchaeota archaeon]|nr:hypothetical protein [Candidatus Woesearchaeota archaeon]